MWKKLISEHSAVMGDRIAANEQRIALHNLPQKQHPYFRDGTGILRLVKKDLFDLVDVADEHSRSTTQLEDRINPAEGCQLEWKQRDGAVKSCYSFHEQTLNWLDAKSKCQEKGIW
ncbi:hypothetical protein CAPTEDRAFT_214466 [Capitella teleta]|uniref:C-type lectin domain-containing protein n=1 Tax=Capitella teleta TaxID=283909 RepID=R7UR48_CAPTE|nr:hypothetical protein CAPTEDRAFT_214466 [Capitella teleta]|eukprot:ELU09014.1 hypothetical protein CAPTEDRAFT_214466 [Capitella teleta]